MEQVAVDSESPQTVLIVAHGSRNAGWVRALVAWHAGVRELLRGEAVRVLLSFLEFSEPLFESELRRLAASGVHPLVLPFFLTQSGHASEDVPRIMESVRGGGVDQRMIQPAGWEGLLAANAERRLAAAGAAPETPVIVSGYGASGHDDEWGLLIRSMQRASSVYRDRRAWLWAPSGHFLADSRAPLRAAIESLQREGGQSAAILSLYLSVSSYQEELVPSVLAEFPGMRFHFNADAVLPDARLERWAAEVILQSIHLQANAFPIPSIK